MTAEARQTMERAAVGTVEASPLELGDAVATRYEIELIEDRAAIPLTRVEWNALAASNETNTIFQTYEWFDSWWKCFGGRGRLYFVLVHARARPVGFVALMARRVAAGMRQLEFVGHGNADYQDFVLPSGKRDILPAVCEFMRSDSKRWDRMLLSNVPQQSLTHDLLAASAPMFGFHVMEESRVVCPTMLLEDRAAEARRTLGKYSVRRPFNWFSREGNVTFRQIAAGEFRAMLPRYFDQHIRRWRAKGMRSLFEDRAHRVFYEELASQLQSTGWLLFSVVEVGGEPVAFHFGFDYGGSIIWYKPSFEIGLASRSPGLLLIRYIVEDALNRGRREVDFTVGNEQFKERFANTERINLNVAVYHNRLLYAAGAAHKLARRSISTLLRLGHRRAWKPTSRPLG